jgi:hypothetical protein
MFCSHLIALRLPVAITIRNTCIIFNSVIATMVLSLPQKCITVASADLLLTKLISGTHI